MTKRLTGRTAVVTGTAHGIGAGIAAALQDNGAVVHGVDKDTVDLTSVTAVREFFAGLGGIDILVNNAGGVCGQIGRPLEDVSDQDWREILDANLTTSFLCTRAVVPAMKERSYGRIITISSAAGLSVSKTGIQAYASAKAAQIGFTRQLAHELGPFGITANCIAPGSSCRTRPASGSGTATAATASAGSSTASRCAGWELLATSPMASCSSRPRNPPG